MGERAPLGARQVLTFALVAGARVHRGRGGEGRSERVRPAPLRVDLAPVQEAQQVQAVPVQVAGRGGDLDQAVEASRPSLHTPVRHGLVVVVDAGLISAITPSGVLVRCVSRRPL